MATAWSPWSPQKWEEAGEAGAVSGGDSLLRLSDPGPACHPQGSAQLRTQPGPGQLPAPNRREQNCPLTFHLAGQGLADHACVILLVCRPPVHKERRVGGPGVKHDPKLEDARVRARGPAHGAAWPAAPAQGPEAHLGVCGQEDVGGLHQDEDERGDSRGHCSPQQGCEDPPLPDQPHGEGRAGPAGGRQQRAAGRLATPSSLGLSPPGLRQQAGPQATPRGPREPQALEGRMGAGRQQAGLAARLAWGAGRCWARSLPF